MQESQDVTVLQFIQGDQQSKQKYVEVSKYFVGNQQSQVGIDQLLESIQFVQLISLSQQVKQAPKHFEQVVDPDFIQYPLAHSLQIVSEVHLVQKDEQGLHTSLYEHIPQLFSCVQQYPSKHFQQLDELEHVSQLSKQSRHPPIIPDQQYQCYPHDELAMSYILQITYQMKGRVNNKILENILCQHFVYNQNFKNLSKNFLKLSL
ncbi:unnamed protein product [Paramecium primaurelia]|uniref:Uncharacterized protein n=1 Tax=Paramecium primaurelia TaxID=5886 RepID=A0A8S1NH49_PARPR|nr:unnamed protein product [Paramecium primaurelia]